MLLGATMIRCSKHYTSKKDPIPRPAYQETSLEKCSHYYNIGNTFFSEIISNKQKFACLGIYKHCEEKSRNSMDECMETYVSKSKEMRNLDAPHNMQSSIRVLPSYLAKVTEYTHRNQLREKFLSSHESELSVIIAKCSMELIDANEAIHFDTLSPCVDVKAEDYMASLKN